MGKSLRSHLTLSYARKVGPGNSEERDADLRIRHAPQAGGTSSEHTEMYAEVEDAHQNIAAEWTLVGRALCGTWRDTEKGSLSGRRGTDCCVATYGVRCG